MSEELIKIVDAYKAEYAADGVEYVDDVPALLRPATIDFDDLISRHDHFEVLDKEPPLDRAARGAKEWNT